MTEVDTAIEEYKRQLTGEAELARADLDEIEDHLRALTADLQTSGLPATAAVREAARRLGEPRALAREHSRVRSVFGAKLSPLRTYSAVALLAVLIGYFFIETAPYRGLGMWVEMAFGAILTGALALRLSWARPILIGGLAFLLLETVAGIVLYDAGVSLWLVLVGGPLAFLIPWQRRELTPSAWALTLQVWAYTIATFYMRFTWSESDGTASILFPAAWIAAGFAVVATMGGILRARWASIASMFSALALAAVLGKQIGLHFRLDLHGYQAYFVGTMVSSVLAALGSAVLSWRSARSTLGTFQHVFR